MFHWCQYTIQENLLVPCENCRWKMTNESKFTYNRKWLSLIRIFQGCRYPSSRAASFLGTTLSSSLSSAAGSIKTFVTLQRFVQAPKAWLFNCLIRRLDRGKTKWSPLNDLGFETPPNCHIASQPDGRQPNWAAVPDGGTRRRFFIFSNRERS